MNSQDKISFITSDNFLVNTCFHSFMTVMEIFKTPAIIACEKHLATTGKNAYFWLWNIQEFKIDFCEVVKPEDPLEGEEPITTFDNNIVVFFNGTLNALREQLAVYGCSYDRIRKCVAELPEHIVHTSTKFVVEDCNGFHITIDASGAVASTRVAGLSIDRHPDTIVPAGVISICDGITPVSQSKIRDFMYHEETFSNQQILLGYERLINDNALGI